MMGVLDAREIDFLDRVARVVPLRVADRTEDKARQRLRRMGLVEFIRSEGRWAITPAGREALSKAKEADGDQPS